VEDKDPWGSHIKICIDYYRDYGEILVDTYCHDVTKDYERETCNAITNLTAEKINDNAILLTWTPPEDDLEVEGYRIIRNNNLLTKAFITGTTYLDENLSNGTYEYYVFAKYSYDCISDASNKVAETITVGIKETNGMKDVMLYPNPAFTTVTIAANNFKKVEIYNTVGQLLQVVSTKVVDVSSYNAGVYFFKIFDVNDNVVTRRVAVVR
jgi:hypothetical protein